MCVSVRERVCVCERESVCVCERESECVQSFTIEGAHQETTKNARYSPVTTMPSKVKGGQ